MSDREPMQLPACDECSQGVMDSTNDHARSLCRCSCHKPKAKPRPDYDPRIDYPERYMREGVWSI